MNVLAVDTSTLRLGIGMITDDGRGFSRRWAEDGHSGHLFGRIEHALSELSLSADDIDLLAVVSGPGSFTGLRIGMAGLLGWAVAAKLPIQTIDSFAAMRASVPDSIFPALIVIHCRGNDFYMQYLESSDMVDPPEPFIGSVNSLVILPAVKCKVCGSGARKLLDLMFDSERNGFEQASADYREPDMEAVCTAAQRLFSERKDAEENYRIEPYYMTLSQAQIKFESRERRV